MNLEETSKKRARSNKNNLKKLTKSKNKDKAPVIYEKSKISNQRAVVVKNIKILLEMVTMNSGRMKREIIILVITTNEKNVDIEKSAEIETSLRIAELTCVLCVLILNGYHNIPTSWCRF